MEHVRNNFPSEKLKTLWILELARNLARDNKEFVPRQAQFAVRNEEEWSNLFEALPLLIVVYYYPFFVRIFCQKTLEEGIKRLDPHISNSCACPVFDYTFLHPFVNWFCRIHKSR